MKHKKIIGVGINKIYFLILKIFWEMNIHSQKYYFNNNEIFKQNLFYKRII